MARLAIGSLALLTVAGFAAFAFACENDDSTSGLNPGPNGPDVTVDGGAGSLDASTPDAESPLPPGTGVTVTVVAFETLPVKDIAVYFHDQSGAVIATHKTDANGKVFGTVAPAQVTVLVGSTAVVDTGNTGGGLVTYTAVAEGDQLVVDATPQPTSIGGASQLHAKWSVSFPDAPAETTYVDVAATRYCGGGNVVDAIPFETRLQKICLAQQNTVLALARSDDFITRGYTWKKGIAYPAEGQTVPVAITEAWTAGSPFTLRGVNFPAGGTPKAKFVLISDGLSFEPRARLTAPGDALTGLSYLVPPAGFTSAIQAALWTEFDPGDAGWALIGTIKRAAGIANMDVDLANPLPRITSMASTGGEGDSSNMEVSWTSESSLANTDGGFVRLTWTRRITADEIVGYSWTFVVPPNVTSFKTPKIPAADLEGPENYSLQIEDSLFAESSLLSGYGALKSIPVGPLRRALGIDPGRPLPADGTVRVTGARTTLTYGYSDWLDDD